jgi:hypothetical protein
VLFSFVKLLFLGLIYKKTGRDKFKVVQQDLVRLIGGAIVFLIAIVASNPWIYFVSFLIGGLLIASEQFMILLAGVLSSDRKNVFKIIKYVSEMTKAEVDQKVESEAIQIIEAEKESEAIEKKEEGASSDGRDVSTEPAKDTKGLKGAIEESGLVDQIVDAKKNIQNFERLILKRVQDNVTWTYKVKQNVRIADSTGRAYVHDAIVIDSDNKLFASAEIKLLGAMKLAMVKKIIDYSNPDNQPSNVHKVYIFGFKEYDFDQTNRLLDYRKKMKAWYSNIGIVYYQYKKDESGTTTLEAINADDMAMFTDSSVELPF